MRESANLGLAILACGPLVVTRTSSSGSSPAYFCERASECVVGRMLAQWGQNEGWAYGRRGGACREEVVGNAEREVHLHGLVVCHARLCVSGERGGAALQYLGTEGGP